MKFDEALGMINALADYGQVPALASREHLSEAQRVVNAEFRRLRKVEAAAEEFIHTGGTWSHNELVKALEVFG